MQRVSCLHCGSSNIVFDAWVIWREDQQQFELDQPFEDSFCRDCEKIASAKWSDFEIYSDSVALNAICIMELTRAEYYSDAHRLYNWLRESEGISYARDTALILSSRIEKGWEHAMRLGFDAPFDWVFLPNLLSALIPISGPNPRDNCSEQLIISTTDLVVKQWQYLDGIDTNESNSQPIIATP